MSYLGFVQKKIVLSIVALSLLSACGEDLQIDDESGQEQVILEGTPFAYVSRDVTSQEQAIQITNEDPSVFVPGANLYVRESINNDATEKDILADVFAGTQYDAKDLNVSNDGRFLIFSAKADTQADTWNIYEYDFETGFIRRVMADLNAANSGNDSNPAYTNDGLVVFSSDRQSVYQGSAALFLMDRDGHNLQVVTTGNTKDLKATALTDGYLAFLRLSSSTGCEDSEANCLVVGDGTEKTSVYRVAPNGQNEQKLVDKIYVNNDLNLASNLQFDNVIQGNDGYLLSIVKNKQTPLMGGQIVKLVGPKASDSSDTEAAVYDFVKVEEITGKDVQTDGSKVIQTGWNSAFWPYRDGTERMLVSWSQCMKQDSGIYRSCTQADTLEGVDARYGIWVYDATTNTRMPVLQAKKGRVYTDIALAVANYGANLEFSEDTTEPTPTEPTPTEPTPTEPTPTEPTPTEPTPTEPTPTEPAPTEPAPTEPTPTEPTPTEPVPTEPTPTEPTEPTEPTPTEPAPTEPTPTEPTPTEPTPIEPTPTEPTPTEPAPTEPTPTEPTPTEPTPTEPAPTEPTPTEPTPTEPTPTEPTPTEPVEGDGMCHGKGYWQNHNRFAANPEQNMPWPVDENTQLCGTTWYQMINDPSEGSAWVILGKHWVASKLNAANGGYLPSDIAGAILSADSMLANCEIMDADRDFALGIKDQLEAYNESDDCLENPETEAPLEPAISTVHIRSVYDLDGMDMSVLGIEEMANPVILPMDNRSERFIRVYTQNLDGETVLNGYSAIQPDGSVMFEIPENTPFIFEVVNAQSKALNNNAGQMGGSEFAYTYMQKPASWLAVSEGEQKELNGLLDDGSESTSINEGAQAIGPFPNTSGVIEAQIVGQTMAQALFASGDAYGALTPAMQYRDYWTPAPLVGSPVIQLGYEGIETQLPVNLACLTNPTSDCVAQISYEQHIKPLWNDVTRNDAGNSCVDCHDNRGFTSLDLSDFADESGLASYNTLFSNNRTYMYLASTFSEVNAGHCRRYVTPPFAMEPENDCFSCYGQALMNPLGAISSANFFDVFASDVDHNHWIFRPVEVDDARQEVWAQHQNMLTPQERKLIAEWLDMGAPR